VRRLSCAVFLGFHFRLVLGGGACKRKADALAPRTRAVYAAPGLQSLGGHHHLSCYKIFPGVQSPRVLLKIPLGSYDKKSCSFSTSKGRPYQGEEAIDGRGWSDTCEANGTTCLKRR